MGWLEDLKKGLKDTYYYDWSWTPKEELLERLNAQQRGIDPGKPLNWRGLH